MSADVILGTPSNMLQAAFLLKLVASLTGKTACTVTVNMADAHIYLNHVDAAKLILDQPLHPNEARLDIPNQEIYSLMSDEAYDELIARALAKEYKVTGYKPGIEIPKEMLGMAV